MSNWQKNYNERFKTSTKTTSKDPIKGFHPEMVFTDWHLNGTVVYEGNKTINKNKK